MFSSLFLLTLLPALVFSSPTSTHNSSSIHTTSTSKHTTSATKHTTTTHHTSTKTTTTASTPLCTPEAQGIVLPTPGTVIVQTQDDNYDPTYVEIVYCSGAYFKESSVDGSVWLSGPEPSDLFYGQLLIKDQEPDNLDSDAGFYSYRFNATIIPIDGTYQTGPMTLSVYETFTGYYNPYNYQISSVNVTLTKKEASAAHKAATN